jgi:hypothetical protein
MFDVQVLTIFTGPKVTSHFSGANALHHYHGVQTTISILLEQDVTPILSSLCGSVVNNFFSGPRGQWSTSSLKKRLRRCPMMLIFHFSWLYETSHYHAAIFYLTHNGNFPILFVTIEIYYKPKASCNIYLSKKQTNLCNY